MFSLTYSTPYKGETKTISFEKLPSTLGENEDVDGNVWDIWGVYGFDGQMFVHARLIQCRKSTSTTFREFGNGSSIIHKTYLPYMVVIQSDHTD